MAKGAWAKVERREMVFRGTRVNGCYVKHGERIVESDNVA
jgi:hypothetical protein